MARDFFGSIFLLFSNKSSRRATLLVAGENPRPRLLMTTLCHIDHKININHKPEHYDYFPCAS